ncbi:MAG: hypothetical protein ACRDMJ_05570 [Solirubrobacteraceae bacterium]
MSATKLRPRDSSTGPRRRRLGQRSTARGRARIVDDAGQAPTPPTTLTAFAVDAPAAPAPADGARPETWWDSLQRAEQARAARLRPMWQMTPRQRVTAMRRGQLTYEQLAAWSARRPEQVPLLNGEFEWIAARMPEVCEGVG